MPKTHCRHGHEFTAENSRVNSQGNRLCVTCHRARKRKWIANNKVKIKAERDRLMFGGNREKAILRDGEVCTDCGMTRQKHIEIFNRDITVDHIDRMGHGVGYDFKNNSLDNLITLCLPCHGRKDGNLNRMGKGQ